MENFRLLKSFISCDFVAVDFLNRIQFSCGFTCSSKNKNFIDFKNAPRGRECDPDANDFRIDELILV